MIPSTEPTPSNQTMERTNEAIAIPLIRGNAGTGAGAAQGAGPHDRRGTSRSVPAVGLTTEAGPCLARTSTLAAGSSNDDGSSSNQPTPRQRRVRLHMAPSQKAWTLRL